ncbi:sigma-E processing peptidase SpoIIGA [Aquibacillus halophilus]|uniref:Sporulation sigma-E factor-processing peptidase n=1 Tax=Aquibacillus halophilus TaxID=930132 RepID=A0A6A8D8T9_9BACI|nr:sigma-E processing peptidase SpoIIGA [Aquibacillus halophilus]
MTIYLDAIWLLNFLLDWMILLLTQSLVRDNTKSLRIISGAFVASVLVPITLFFPDSFFSSTVGKGLYSLLIIMTAFGFKNIRQFIKKLLSFYFISFALGGGLIALHFMLGKQISASNNGILTFQSGYGDQISWLFVGIGFPIIWWFTKSQMDKQALQNFRNDQLYNVTIQLKGKSFTTIGYVDSGNQLVDPFSKKPVVICDQSFLSHWFTAYDLQLLESAQVNLDFEQIPSEWEDVIHLVPYQGVGGNRTFMIVLKPDKILVNYEDKEISTKNVLIGIQFGDLASDGSYHCLLHPKLFKHSVATSA